MTLSFFLRCLPELAALTAHVLSTIRAAHGL